MNGRRYNMIHMTTDEHGVAVVSGTSEDSKPTNVKDRSTFIEADTGKRYQIRRRKWYLYYAP